MTSVFAIVRRILTQFALDKRTLALLFVAPLVVLWLLSVIHRRRHRGAQICHRGTCLRVPSATRADRCAHN